MAEVQKPRLTEIIQTPKAGYSRFEQRLIGRIYPNLRGTSEGELLRLFSVNDEPLSVVSISMLNMMFPARSPEEMHTFLHDPEAVRGMIMSVKTGSTEQQQRSWPLLAILPLDPEIKRLMFVEDIDQPPTSITAHVVEEPARTDEAVIQRTSQRVNLPVANLPHLETYLASHTRRDYFGIPEARIYVTPEQGSSVVVLQLTEEETAAAFMYSHYLLRQIDSNRDDVIARYRQEHGLGDEAAIDYRKVKEYYFRQHIDDRLRQLAQEKCTQPQLPVAVSRANVELHFTQNKLGLSKDVAQLLRDPALLRQFVDTNSSPSQSSSDGPQMIPLTQFTDVLDAQTFSWTDVPERERHVPNTQTASEEPPPLHTDPGGFNELQRAHLAIANATRSGDWSRAIDIYLEYLEYWPQFIEHRIAVIDMFQRSQTGQIPRFPQRILSIASGPHEELRALYDMQERLGYHDAFPHVVNVDNSAEMLAKSRERLPAHIREAGEDVVADMRELPQNLGRFDLVECSSFDNLSRDQDIAHMVSRAVGMVESGGIIRFMVADPFSDEFCAALEKNGIVILEKNKRPRFNDAIRDHIREQYGDDGLERLEYKTRRHRYFLAQVPDTVDSTALEADLDSVSIFVKRSKKSSSTRATVQRAILGTIEQEDLVLNIMQTIALNPVYFLEKKGLTAEHIQAALSKLQGHVSSDVAMQLYQQYFGTAHEALPQFQVTVFDLVQDLPRFRQIFSIHLVRHENEAIRSRSEAFLLAHFPDYLGTFFEIDLPQEEKQTIWAQVKHTDAFVAKLTAYLQKRAVSGENLGQALSLLQTLPTELKLEIPILFRFSAGTRDFYFKHGSGEVLPSKLTKQEIEKLFELPAPVILGNERMGKRVIELVVKYGRAQKAVELLQAFQSHPDHIVIFLPQLPELMQLVDEKIRQKSRSTATLLSSMRQTVSERRQEHEQAIHQFLRDEAHQLFRLHFKPPLGQETPSPDYFFPGLVSIAEQAVERFNIKPADAFFQLSSEVRYYANAIIERDDTIEQKRDIFAYQIVGTLFTMLRANGLQPTEQVRTNPLLLITEFEGKDHCEPYQKYIQDAFTRSALGYEVVLAHIGFSLERLVLNHPTIRQQIVSKFFSTDFISTHKASRYEARSQQDKYPVLVTAFAMVPYSEARTTQHLGSLMQDLVILTNAGEDLEYLRNVAKLSREFPEMLEVDYVVDRFSSKLSKALLLEIPRRKNVQLNIIPEKLQAATLTKLKERLCDAFNKRRGFTTIIGKLTFFSSNIAFLDQHGLNDFVVKALKPLPEARESEKGYLATIAANADSKVTTDIVILEEDFAEGTDLHLKLKPGGHYYTVLGEILPPQQV